MTRKDYNPYSLAALGGSAQYIEALEVVRKRLIPPEIFRQLSIADKKAYVVDILKIMPTKSIRAVLQEDEVPGAVNPSVKARAVYDTDADAIEYSNKVVGLKSKKNKYTIRFTIKFDKSGEALSGDVISDIDSTPEEAWSALFELMECYLFNAQTSMRFNNFSDLGQSALGSVSE